ncbi:hypothetical protein JOF50_000382 [Corynebacterium mucifaciens]|uniref:Uncharacterized protein n=1 Tax=Corynebacterium mucifaciens TaxID=57171 RepID=A0ABV2NVH6_9CORY
MGQAGTRPQPKIHTPRKMDSNKKAASPSNARGAPKTSPTKLAYSGQFMPNWNSCMVPVTTPIAKLTRKRFPKNRVARYQRSWPVRSQIVCMMATIGARPMVSGAKM